MLANWAGQITNSTDTFTTASNPPGLLRAPSNRWRGCDRLHQRYEYDDEAKTDRQSPGQWIGCPHPELERVRSEPDDKRSVLPQEPRSALCSQAVVSRSPFTYNYVTSTSINGPGGKMDTNFFNIALNMRIDIDNNTRGNSGPLTSVNVVAENPEQSNAHLTFGYNPNINSSGVARLGAGMTISGSDNASSATYDFGYINLGGLFDGKNYMFTYSAIAGGWIARGFGTNASRAGQRPSTGSIRRSDDPSQRWALADFYCPLFRRSGLQHCPP